jgi:3',5'-cyclic AMP phosphodiesterase CpdA
MDSSVPGEVHGELADAQLEALADELDEPATDGTVLVVHHPPIWSTAPMSELVALREPGRLAAVIRGSDVRLVLSGHTHRVSAGALAGVPVWVSPSTGCSPATASADMPEGGSRASTSSTMARSSRPSYL